MNKRPMCAVCCCFIVVLLVFDMVGLSQLLKPPKYALLQEQAKDLETCTLQGEVQYYERKTKSIYIYLNDVILNVHSEQYSLKRTIVKYAGTKPFEVGNTLMVTGTLTEIEAATNPGQFNARAYYCARNINFFIKDSDFQVTDKKVSPIRGWLYWFREAFRDKLEQLIPEDKGVLSAMLLGDKTILDEELKTRYQMSGMMHILTISGLHLSILGMGCYKLLQKAGMNQYLAGALAAVFLVCYGIMTGEGVSVLRGVTMFLLSIGARYVGRTYDMLSALSLSAILILLEYPGYLYDGGFQLSFSALLGFGVVLPALKEATAKKKGKEHLLKRKIKEGLRSGVAVWMTTLPIILWWFYEVTVYGLLLNLFVIPTAAVILTSGIVGGGLGFLNGSIGRVFLLPAVAILWLYDRMGAVVQRLPYATVILGRPTLWQCVGYYVILIVFLVLCQKEIKNKWAKYLHCAGTVIAAIFLTVFIGMRFSNGLSVTALDIGQGDALVIKTPGAGHYLVDGGSSSVDGVGVYRIIPYLKSQGIRNLEAVMVTHSDADHISGIMELFDMIAGYQTSLTVKQCIMPEWMRKSPEAKQLREAAKKGRIPIVYVSSGDVIRDGEVNFQVLHPGEQDYSDNPNAGSLTFVLSYGAFRGMFTGDLCEDGEDQVCKRAEQCQLLKVAHHGSRFSTEEAFLEKVCPRVSIISCGKNNLYGHPHPELIKRLQDAESEICNTAKEGAVTVRTDGEEGMEVSVFCP